jgi:hypothetical protein
MPQRGGATAQVRIGERPGADVPTISNLGGAFAGTSTITGYFSTYRTR